MIFARCVFLGAGIYGLLALLPVFFLESRIGREQPPALTHPEYFYGFLGLGVAWQIAFFIIARNPVRLCPLMVPSALEKASFALATVSLFALGRIPGQILAFGLTDLALALLFVIAYVRTSRHLPSNQ